MANTKRPSPDGQGGPTLDANIDTLVNWANEHNTDQTGRYIALIQEPEAAIDAVLGALTGARVAHASDFTGREVEYRALSDAGALVFDHLGAALIVGAPDRITQAAADASYRSMIIVPETLMFVDSEVQSYLKGFRSAADLIFRDLENSKEQIALFDNYYPTTDTWGLSATRVPASPFSGRGIRVAILDTGIDLGHPDFQGRNVVTQSFVPNELTQDGHGHGTHVAGTTCGAKTPRTSGPRYGIAYEADLYVGKVLSNQGSGATGWILNGINWAIDNGCHLINLSLGGSGGPDPAYTQAGQAALNRGTLIIAAAGNSGGSTGRPANSPTIMSVAALSQELQKAPFSSFGKVEISGPGVNVESSLPRPRNRGILSGTSMACPHVTGIAALHAQGHGHRGLALWRHLQATAKKLPEPPTHVGTGCVQA